jgi:hypothetical protein
MDPIKQEALEAAGWKVGDAAEFLQLSEEERQALEQKRRNDRALRALDELHQYAKEHNITSADLEDDQ